MVSATPFRTSSGFEVIANEIERGKQLGQSFQGVVLALQRDKDRVGGGQGVHRQQSERRWTVDEDVVVFVEDLGQKPAESSLPPFDRRELYLGPGQRDRRRDQGEPIVDRHPKNELGQVRPIDDGVVHGPFDGVTSEAKPARRVPLGVEIDDEDSFARSGEIAPQVDDRRGLADAALLVRAGDRLAHSVSCSDGSHDAQFYHRWPSDLRSGRGASVAVRDRPALNRRSPASRGVSRETEAALIGCAAAITGQPSGVSRETERQAPPRTPRCFT